MKERRNAKGRREGGTEGSRVAGKEDTQREREKKVIEVLWDVCEGESV